MKLSGKASWFGGPDDTGVSSDEDLALYWEESQIALHPEMFLPEQPSGTTGLARRLNPDAPYLAVRWSYEGYSKDELRDALFMVYAPRTGRAALARAVDWGPHTDTGRVADLSPGLLHDVLGIDTDDDVEIFWPVADTQKPPAQTALTVAISSGHSTKVRGAVGIIDEVDEATRVVDEVARLLNERGVTCYKFHDDGPDASTTQNENLEKICDWHNSKKRDLDVSVHFNANVPTASGVGTECWYLTQETLAEDIADAIAGASGLKDRGPKFSDGLFFLTHTDQPAILIEVCFVDSEVDCEAYLTNFEEICKAVAGELANEPLTV